MSLFLQVTIFLNIVKLSLSLNLSLSLRDRDRADTIITLVIMAPFLFVLMVVTLFMHGTVEDVGDLRYLWTPLPKTWSLNWGLSCRLTWYWFLKNQCWLINTCPSATKSRKVSVAKTFFINSVTLSWKIYSLRPYVQTSAIIMKRGGILAIDALLLWLTQGSFLMLP